tara:strand:+ start:172 stop:393 length:222 start_codon:yes stop_codon:yes gene_type:complete
MLILELELHNTIIHIVRYTKPSYAKPAEMLLTISLCPANTLGSLAQVAELVDAQVSGTCGGNLVEVRVFSWAP